MWFLWFLDAAEARESEGQGADDTHTTTFLDAGIVVQMQYAFGFRGRLCELKCRWLVIFAGLEYFEFGGMGSTNKVET